MSIRKSSKSQKSNANLAQVLCAYVVLDVLFRDGTVHQPIITVATEDDGRLFLGDLPSWDVPRNTKQGERSIRQIVAEEGRCDHEISLPTMREVLADMVAQKPTGSLAKTGRKATLRTLRRMINYAEKAQSNAKFRFAAMPEKA